MNPAYVVLAAVAIAVTVHLIPKAKEDLSPVVENMQAVSVDKGGGVFTARVFGEKVRKCAPILAEPYIRHAGSSQWTENAEFEFLRDKTPMSSKPQGKHDFGEWQWRSLKGQEIQKVILVMVHNCDGVTVRTEIGPFS